MNITAKTIQKHLDKGGLIKRACWPNTLYLRKVTPGTDVSALLSNAKRGEELWVPAMRQLMAKDWVVIPLPSEDGKCCAKEKRSMAGGCSSCGDPSF